MNISNGLSLIRAPLAFLFLQTNPLLRLFAIFLATLTDSIDGYLARRYQSTSHLGAILDPLMDKFFVFFTLSVLFQEGSISLFEIMTMLSRDFALCLYGISMKISGRWKSVVFRSVRWGKITTALQFIVIAGLVCGYPFPTLIAYAFIAMGVLALLELFQRSKVVCLSSTKV